MTRWFVACGCILALACDGGSTTNDPGGGGDIPAMDVPGDPGQPPNDQGQPPQDPGGTDVAPADPGQTEDPTGTSDQGTLDPGGATDPGGTTDPGPGTDPGSGGVTYRPPDPSTTFTYLLKACDENPPQEVPARISETEEIGGQTWRRLEVGDFEAETRNGFVSFTRIRDGRYEVIGSDVYMEGQKDPFLSWRFDQPIGGPISGEAHLTEPTTAKGTFCVMGNCDPYEMSVTYTLVSTSETIEVAYGTVSDCIHIRFEQRSTDLGDTVLESNWWVKSGIGLIKATEVPGYCGLELKAVHP